MKFLLLVLLVFLAVSCVWSYHYYQGNVSDGVVLTNRAIIQLNAKPFEEVTKTFYFPGAINQIIQGIQAIDKLESQASVEVTSGGVGHTFVKMKFQSDEGKALDYEVLIYGLPGQAVIYE